MGRMRTIYAIGDIHGEKALLDDIHRQIVENAVGRAGDKLAVYLGDYIDRGPDSRGVVEALMEGALPFPAVFLMGNHEALCLDPDPYDWLANGGRRTEASYRGSVSESHKAWMRGLPLTYRAGCWFFAHAGIDPLLPLAEQDRETLLWIRRPFLDYRGEMPEGVVVVHGHTPKRAPDIRPNRIGIDTGACYGGALTCAVLTNRLECIIQARHSV
jgi:serine/threonine protein phosphatase 1